MCRAIPGKLIESAKVRGWHGQSELWRHRETGCALEYTRRSTLAIIYWSMSVFVADRSMKMWPHGLTRCSRTCKRRRLNERRLETRNPPRGSLWPMKYLDEYRDQSWRKKRRPISGASSRDALDPDEVCAGRRTPPQRHMVSIICCPRSGNCARPPAAPRLPSRRWR